MEILFWSLLKYIWPFFTTGHWKAKRCSGNLSGTITWNQKHRASCFLWKSCSENFWELPPRKSFMTEHILKALNYAEYELCHWCFSRNFPKIFRTAILKEKLPMHVSYFIKEHLGMGATDEVTPKKTFDGSKPSSKLTLIRLWTQITFCYRKCMLPHTLTLIGYNISGCLLFGCPICDKIFHFCPKQP